MNELAFNSMHRVSISKNILIKSILPKKCFHKMALNKTIINTKQNLSERKTNNK